MLRILLFAAYILAVTISHNVYAAKQRKPAHQLPSQTSLVIDSSTGQILHQQNSTIQIYPASLTKLMTLYILFDHLDSKKVTMDEKLYVSKNAEKALPCKLGIKAGEFITVKDSILALSIRSANDVSTVVAEHLMGNEEKFAVLMNKKARELGMKNTHFKNASGWHHRDQKTTARDLAKLALALRRDHPKYYKYFALNSFTFRGKVVNGHNTITATYPGAEGLKTGYTSPAGYNLITTATRNGKSLLGIVTGGRSSSSRDQKMKQLLDTHFAQIEGKKIAANNFARKRSQNI